LEKEEIITILESIDESKSEMRRGIIFFFFKKPSFKWAGFLEKKEMRAGLFIF